MKIKEVGLHFPNSEQGDIVYYKVGSPFQKGKAVTEIKAVSMSPQPYCEKVHYEIYTEDGLVMEMHQYGYVEYFKEGV